jgi:nondiscriminating glutamyl-tRNA synthetase
MIRTRFAPSPTGRLHLGNLRIAIFNHLFTQHHGGSLVIRIEDTDLERNVPGATEQILEDLAWAGITWNEGPDCGGAHGPYRQSERIALYQRWAEQLRAHGKVYPCFCDDPMGGGAEAAEGAEGAERGWVTRDGAPQEGCPGQCARLSADEVQVRRSAGVPHALRFPVPRDREIAFTDAVRGDIRVQGRDLGDFVILRADGRPTYNFAVVVDDVEMAITHVIRGAGHVSNTTRQILLFEAMGVAPPVFAHLPTILGKDRKKLSKREGAQGVEFFRKEGFPPEGVMNYLSLLGWSPGDDREVLLPDELAKEMTLDRVGASDAIFDPEKLTWICAQHLALLPLETLAERVAPWVDRIRFPLTDEELVRAVAAIRTRLHTLSEVNAGLEILFPPSAVLEAGRAAISEEGGWEVVRGVRAALEKEEQWDAETLGQRLREVGKALGAKGPTLFHPVRLALCAARSGPDLGLILVAIGREEALRRFASPA